MIIDLILIKKKIGIESGNFIFYVIIIIMFLVNNLFEIVIIC